MVGSSNNLVCTCWVLNTGSGTTNKHQVKVESQREKIARQEVTNEKCLLSDDIVGEGAENSTMKHRNLKFSLSDTRGCGQLVCFVYISLHPHTHGDIYVYRSPEQGTNWMGMYRCYLLSNGGIVNRGGSGENCWK